MLFSVLIPVYNAEKNLDACLQSVIDQTEQDFEIILCDDGSTDNSLEICQKYEAAYRDTVRIIANGKNEGLLLTRRRLFAAANGRYCLCVDADDELEDGALSALRNSIRETDADMIVFNARCIHLDRSEESFKPQLAAGRLYAKEDKSVFYEALFRNKYLNSLCTKAFKREILDMCVDYSSWKKLTIGEDIFQSFPLFERANSIYYLDQSLYRYYKRENSITTSEKPHFYEMRKMLWEREDEYLSSWHVCEETIGRCSRTRCHEIIRYAVTTAKENPYRKFHRIIDEIRQDGYFAHAMEKANLSGRFLLYGRLLLHNAPLLLYLSLLIESAINTITRMRTPLRREQV